MLVLVALCAGVVLPNLKVETDILALLPTERGDETAEAAVDAFSQRLARKQLFLVGATTAQRARLAAQRFTDVLEKSGAFERVDLNVASRASDQLDLYKAHRGYLLGDRDLEMLRAGNVDLLHREALRAAYTPAGLMRPLSLAEDPLGLAADFILQQVPAMGAAHLDGANLVVTDGERVHILIVAELKGSPFAGSVQEQVIPAIAAATAQARDALGTASADFKLVSSGVVQHADAAARRANAEIQTFGTLETITVLVLLIVVFGALRPLLLGTLAFTLATAAGITLTQFMFGRVHILALVFGSSLIGGVIDYSIHFFADRFRDPDHWTPASAVEHVGSAILLGLTTTLLGYAVLVIVPFPGLRQIAVFCISGLVVGCGTVLCMYPLLTRWRRKPPPFGPYVGRKLDELMQRWRWTRPTIAVCLALTVLIVIGLTRVQIQDDVRALQSSPPELLANERAMAALLKTGVESRFFLVRAASAEELLQREEALSDKLDTLRAAGKLAVYTAVTRNLPSLATQHEAHDLLSKRVYVEGGLLQRFMHELGFTDDAIRQRLAEFARSEPLTPDAWLASPAAESYRSLWLGVVDAQYASVVTLGGVKDVSALQDVAHAMPGVRLIDRVNGVTEVLRSYRRAMSWLLAIIYCVAGCVLATRFGWRDVPLLLLPSVLATGFTLGVFGWFAVPVNLFTLLALWLVLGLGIDYGIFLRHGHTARTTAILSVTLSAVTTLIAFGLLAFSATPFIRSIGLTLLLSITFSWAFVMLSCLTHLRSEGSGL